MEPVQSLNLNRRYISGLEPEMPVTKAHGFLLAKAKIYILNMLWLRYEIKNNNYARARARTHTHTHTNGADP